jgi:uncharacterized membrane protein
VTSLDRPPALSRVERPPVRWPPPAARRPLAWLASSLLAAGLLALIVWPLVLRPDYFGDDWRAHYWFVWHQTEWLLQQHRPTFFLHYRDGVFYPQYAFYGGTLYTSTALLAVVLGSVRNGYVASWIIAFAAAYGGWFWLARLAGLGRWVAHVPGAVFLTSPYLLTTAYVRGDWPEFVGVCAIPLLAASAVSVLRSDRLRPLPMLALAASTVYFSGSHNLTLLWGGTFLMILAAALYAGVPAVRGWVTGPAVLRLLLVVVPALLVNAWFLVPDVIYGGHTQLGSHFDWGR